MEKLGLWHRQAQKGIAASFPNLDTAPWQRKIGLKGELRSEFEAHLDLDF